MGPFVKQVRPLSKMDHYFVCKHYRNMSQQLAVVRLGRLLFIPKSAT